MRTKLTFDDVIEELKVNPYGFLTELRYWKRRLIKCLVWIPQKSTFSGYDYFEHKSQRVAINRKYRQFFFKPQVHPI